MRLTVACPYIVVVWIDFAGYRPVAGPGEGAEIRGAAEVREVRRGEVEPGVAERGSGDPVAEFIPKGETLEKWTHLASIRRFPEQDDPQALAKTTVEGVAEQYPGAPTNIQNDPQGSDAVIEFIVSPPDDSFAEYNLFATRRTPAAASWRSSMRCAGMGIGRSFWIASLSNGKSCWMRWRATGLELPKDAGEEVGA